MTVGLLSVVSQLSLFNGGKSQVNFNFIGTSSDFPYLNLLKTAGAGVVWGPNSGTAPVTPDMLDSNGYPTSLGSTGGVNTGTFNIPSQSERPGNMAVTWTGNGTITVSNSTVLPTATFTGSVTSNVLTAGAPTGGTIQKGMILSTGGIIGNQISGSAGVAGTYNLIGGTNTGSQSMTVTGGSKTGSGGSGRFVFSVTSTTTNLTFGITGLSVTNVNIFHVDDEADINAGKLFGAKFKQQFALGKWGVARFLNWVLNNTTNVTTWSTRKTRGYVAYGGGELRSNLYAGFTTGTNSYVTASFPAIHSSDGTAWTSGAPKDKDTIHIVYGSSAAAAPCTLDVGTTGTAINITNRASNALGASSYPVGGTTASMATLVYDALLNTWIQQGGGAAGGPDNTSQGINNCVPVEDIIQLCKEVGAHPYICAPALALTPMTDYMPSLAAYCIANGPSWMVPRFEGPNELWNDLPLSTYYTSYAKNVATAYGWAASDYHNWYGKATSTMGQALATAYGVAQANVLTQTKYQATSGVQTGAATGVGNILNFNPRMTSASYVNNLGGLQSPPQSGYQLSAASNWITHVCDAQYYSSSFTGDPNIEPGLVTAFSGKAFVASAVNGVMTVTLINASNSTSIQVGDLVFDSPLFAVNSLPAGVTIASLGTGTGGTGTYNLSSSVSFSSQNMTGCATLVGAYSYADACSSPSSPVTFLNGTPGQMVWTAHPFVTNDRCNIHIPYPNGALPTGASSSTIYFVNVVDANHVTLSTTQGGTPINLSGAAAVGAVAFKGFGEFTREQILFYHTSWQAWANAFGVPNVCGYEGGYSQDFSSAGNSQGDLFRAASLADPNLSTLNTGVLNDFVGLTGAGLTATFPSNYLFSGGVARGYPTVAWSVQNDIYQNPTSPQFNSVAAFNN